MRRKKREGERVQRLLRDNTYARQSERQYVYIISAQANIDVDWWCAATCLSKRHTWLRKGKEGTMKATREEGQSVFLSFLFRLYVSFDWNHKTVGRWNEWWVCEKDEHLSEQILPRKEGNDDEEEEDDGKNCGPRKEFCQLRGGQIKRLFDPLLSFTVWSLRFAVFSLFLAHIDFLSFSISIIVWMKETLPSLTSSSIQIWNVTFACSIRWKLEEQIALHCLLERWHWPFFFLFSRAFSLSLHTWSLLN